MTFPGRLGSLWSPPAMVVYMALAMQILEYNGIFGNAEGIALNIYQRDSWYDSVGTKVFTIGINQLESDELFGGMSPLHPDAVRSLVAAIQRENPAVVGVDLITDAEGYAGTDSQRPWPGETPARSDAPASRVVWAAGAFDPRVHFAQFLPRLLSWSHDHVIATPRLVLNQDPANRVVDWGLAIYPTDDDGVVRRLPRQWFVDDGDRAFENTFARQVARAYCRAHKSDECEQHAEAHEVLLPFDKEALEKRHDSVSALFACVDLQSRVCRGWKFVGKSADAKPDWAGAIVLLGGNYPDMNDWHRTPIDERTPGLFINASAVLAELEGPRLERFGHLFGFALDLALGGLIIWIFKLGEHKGLRTRIVACLIFPPAIALVAGFLLFEGLGLLWVSWVGMLLTGLSYHILLEVMHHSSGAEVLSHGVPPPQVKGNEAPPPAEEGKGSTPSTPPAEPTS